MPDILKQHYTSRNPIVFMLMYLISSLTLRLITEISIIDLGDIIFHSTEPIFCNVNM
jgi:hypothetical protein